MFLSKTPGKLDAKGRLLVPASFRASLAGADGSATCYLRRSFEGAFLEGGGAALMAKYAALLDQFGPHEDARADFAYSIFAACVALTMDSGGRICPPADLLAHAGITDDLVVVGVGDRFQIWNPTLYAAREQEAIARAARTKAALRPLASASS